MMRMHGLLRGARGARCALGSLIAVSAASAFGSGCSVKQPTELIPGVTSQVVVPHDLQSIRITIQTPGHPVPDFDEGYDVGPNGTVSLPSTLGVVAAGSNSTTVTLTVRGYDVPCDMSDDCKDLTDMPVGAGGAKILRRSIQSFVDGHTLFVPMPLTYSCWNTDCGSQGMACKGNTCIDATTATESLPDYNPSMLDGTDVCFDPAECFGQREGGAAAAVAPTLVDYDSCTYALIGQPGSGLNVRVYYQNFGWVADGTGAYHTVFRSGGEQEVLSQDPIEGFSLVTPSADAGIAGMGTQFKLAPGLCTLVHQSQTPPPSPDKGGSSTYITISDVRAAAFCAPKMPLLPICAPQQTNAPQVPGSTDTDGACNVPFPLQPTPSALYMAVDHSDYMYGAFGVNGSASALDLTLGAPVLKNTSTAFKFLPGDLADCTGASTTFATFDAPDVDFDRSATVQPKIGMALDGWAPSTMPSELLGTACTSDADCGAVGSGQFCANKQCISPSPLGLQAAMRLDTGAYAHLASFLNGATPHMATAMFVVNRVPAGANDCPLPVPVVTTVKATLEGQITAAFNATPSMQTDFVVLGSDNGDPAPLAFYQGIAADLPQAVQVIDGTNLQSAGTNFTKLVTQMGTCLYEDALPAGADLSMVQLSYTTPAMPSLHVPAITTTVPRDATCNTGTQSTANGWNVDGGRIRVCGNACQSLRNNVAAAMGYAAQNKIAVPDVPMTAQVLCAGTSPAAASDGGGSLSGGGDDGGAGSTGGMNEGGASVDLDGGFSAPDGTLSSVVDAAIVDADLDGPGLPGIDGATAFVSEAGH